MIAAFFRLLIVLYNLAGFLVFCLGYAHAQKISDSHLQAARKVITAIHATDQFDIFLPRTMLELKNELMRKDPNLEKIISQTVEEQALLIVQRRTDLENEAIRIYAIYFTESELNDIAKFYSSPVGKKLLESGPKAVADSISAFDVWCQGVARDLVENVEGALDKKLGTSRKEGYLEK